MLCIPVMSKYSRHFEERKTFFSYKNVYGPNENKNAEKLSCRSFSCTMTEFVREGWQRTENAVIDT